MTDLDALKEALECCAVTDAPFLLRINNFENSAVVVEAAPALIARIEADAERIKALEAENARLRDDLQDALFEGMPTPPRTL